MTILVEFKCPNYPQTFELVGKDRDGYEVVRYGFVLKQWFVIRNPPGTSRGEEIKESEGDKSPSSNDTDYKENPERYTYSNAKAWCESLGYRLPYIKDLTNAKCSYTIDGPRVCRGAVSATPISDDQFHYQRRIGSGMTGEWGELSRYRINPSNLGRYMLLSAWTGDSRLDYPNEHPFAVNLNNGMISPDRTSEANEWSSYCHRLNNGTEVDSFCLGQALCVTP
ncbi:hypothetical protein GA0061080_100258 [Gilliamella intestini]|uniref:Uncharacterized protein n=1 Tax=Gilliamella intestini TaxID=1798183 RepID=A0A1C3YZU3_9GAMM|nr:hypothetical protein GA0061080_100258 [Gilliamella intestini]